MTYEMFFAGVGATILGTLIGVWAAPRLMYPFQKKLLQQQLDFEKQLAEQAEKEAKDRHDQMLKTVDYLRDTLNERGKQLVAAARNASSARG